MEIIDIRDKTKSLAESFMKELHDDIYILGTNKYGLSTARWLINHGYSVRGFINDYSETTEFETFKVIKSKTLSGKFHVINCIVEGRAIDAKKSILELSPSSQIEYFSLQLQYRDDLLQIDFMDNTDTITEDIPDYKKLYSLLADDESKETLEQILNFRLNRNIQYLEKFKFRLKEQYFEPFIQLDKEPVFVDGGGFDGGTSKLFSELYPEFQKIYYFEPNFFSMDNSKKNLSGIPNIEFFQKGLWSKTEKLHFDNSLGSASKLSDSGGESIDTVSMDELVSSKVDFIKFDIEGAECNALLGARKTIIQNKPALAVCVYHNQKDFLNVPKIVLEFNPDYKIYLRHYTQGVFETVMYFI